MRKIRRSFNWNCHTCLEGNNPLDGQDNKMHLALNFLGREGQWRISSPFNGPVGKVDLVEASNGPKRSFMKVPSKLQSSEIAIFRSTRCFCPCLPRVP